MYEQPPKLILSIDHEFKQIDDAVMGAVNSGYRDIFDCRNRQQRVYRSIVESGLELPLSPDIVSQLMLLSSERQAELHPNREFVSANYANRIAVKVGHEIAFAALCNSDPETARSAQTILRQGHGLDGKISAYMIRKALRAV